jgi:hypothetical protein
MVLTGNLGGSLGEQMDQRFISLSDLSDWADSIVSAANEGLRYQRWWEARLPIEELRRQYREEQIEKARRASAWFEQMTSAKSE